jgi:6,7-dimethyl-8-ribityllumazine synthase
MAEARRELKALPSVDGAKFLIVEARYYDGIGEMLLTGATRALEAVGATYDVVNVPGALEIPAAIRILTKGGGYAGAIALGCVIRGETYHFEIVSDQSAAGIMALGTRGLIIGNGVLTVEDEAQAWARARISEGDKGGGAARACMDLIELKKRLRLGLGG